MNEKVLELLHELLCRVKPVRTTQELETIIREYTDKLGACDSELLEVVRKDIQDIGNELVVLRREGFADTRKRQLATLTEQEQAELVEVERIIDRNLFGYHFQPIVSAADGEIYAYEALMRPQSDLCPRPYHIIKYAELTERLNDIERATFLNILGIVDGRKQELGGRRVFINSIPRTKLAEADYKRVNELLEKHSDTVVVEMTEQAELEDAEFSIIKEQYRRMNVKIAVDDYGTGYSNVQNLLRYMPNYVKIDRSLLSEIQNSPKKRHFVREIIEFCRDNHILALAEGVETAEELKTVILLGADLIQGYYTARPAAAIADTIPYEIKQEIKRYRQEREEGRRTHIYVADKSERVLLDKLAKEDYSSVLIGKNGNGDVTIASMPGAGTNIHLDIINGFKGSIVLENAELSDTKKQHCIDIGENCEVRLVLEGINHLKKGGIRVPESSKLVIGGEGRLSITIDGSGCYGIGNDANSTHGELVFEQGVSIENRAAEVGVCIGSGQGGKIRILHGQFVLNMVGKIGVGIGAVYADTDLDLFGCDIATDVSLNCGVAIGSISGNCRTHIHSAAVKLYLSGEKVVGVGTLSGKKCEVEICEASSVFNIIADKCSAVAALEGDTSFKLIRAGMHITAEGSNALALGALCGDTKVELINADSSVRLVNTSGHIGVRNNEDIMISGGRARFIVNGEEIILLN